MSSIATTTQPRTFKELISTPSYKKGLTEALPPGVTPERITKIIVSAMNKNPDLLLATPSSMYESCIDCAALNLWPGVQGHMYLITRNNRIKQQGRPEIWEKQAQAMVGFRGMIELAYRSGHIVHGSFIAQPIHENDEFSFEYGSTSKVTHKPRLGNRGPIIGAWCGAKPIDGDFVFHVMDGIEIDAIMARSKSVDKDGNIIGPWRTDYAEMACKTVLRRFWKYLPSSVIDQHIDALEKDMAQEFDLKAVASRVVSEGDSRFSDDTPAPVTGKDSLDAATKEVEHREADVATTAIAPVITVTAGQCIELAKQLPPELVDGMLDSFQVHSIASLEPDRLPELHATLSKAIVAPTKGKK